MEVILRTSFTPPIRVQLAPGQAEGSAVDQSAVADALLKAVRPSIEAAGLRIEPWGKPTDWRVPVAILVGLSLLGLVALVKGIKS